MNNVERLQTTSSSFHPDGHHQSVDAVMTDRKLSKEEKRSILSAWASDMYAVESSPQMRMIPGHAAPVRLSAILAALRQLDRGDPPPRGGMGMRMPPASSEIELRDRRTDCLWRPIVYKPAIVATISVCEAPLFERVGVTSVATNDCWKPS